VKNRRNDDEIRARALKEPERLKIKGDWERAVKKALKKGRPPKKG
jgi:hypothetical protein